MALLKLSVAATAGGASGEVAGICDDEPMCMHTTVSVSCAGREERVPVAAVDRLGRPSCGGISLKQTARTPRSALRRTSAAASVDVPQRDEAQRDQRAVASRRTTPRPSSRCRPARRPARGPCPRPRGRSGRRSGGRSGSTARPRRGSSPCPRPGPWARSNRAASRRR